ncbi:MAG: 6-carboxytetrahydropterin synthase [Phycisphaerae bacterium]|nr:6-carboxytetrahydropterin synthase [Phycisphaerae bacterium]
MHTLTRTIRFSVNPGRGAETGSAPANGFAGIPSMRGLGRYYELHVTCRGEPRSPSGYLLNIKEIDTTVHAGVIPLIAQACRDNPESNPVELLPGIVEEIRRRLGGVFERVRWNLTPYYSLEMTADTSHVLLRQSFDFSAAHRLHVPSLTDEQNRALFGKCNNPSGHGHNYRVEPCVAVRTGAQPAFGLDQLEALVHERIIRPYDHTHLNEDTAEFGGPSGVNPSVENIARVFFERLAEPIRAGSGGSASLRTLTVWETDRTSATFPA